MTWTLLPKTTVGIELAGPDLRIAIVRSFLNRRRLVHVFEISGFSTLSDDEKRQRLTDLRKKQGLPQSRVHLALPHDLGVIRQIELPVEVRTRVEQVVRLQLDTFAPWPVDDIYWGFSSESPRKGAKTLTATISMIPKSALDSQIELFGSVGLPLSGVSLSAVAWVQGVSDMWVDSRPTIILGCEEGYVEGALLHGPKLFAATQKGNETALHARAIVEKLVALGRVVSPEDVRLITHGAAVESLPGGSDESEDASVRLPMENAHPGSIRKFGAIAAAGMGLGGGSFDVNVLPAEMRYRASQLRLVPTYILAVLAVLSGVLLLAREPYQNTLYAARIESEIQRLAGGVDEISEQGTRLNQMDERYRALVGHIRSRDRNLEILETLATALPATAWLSNYSYQDGSITISGFAENTADLQRFLEDSPLLQGVRFTGPVTRDPSSGRNQFRISATLQGVP